jgi:hypothetical protein
MSVSPFFHVIGFTIEPDAQNIIQKMGRRQATLVVLPSDEPQWDLKFSDIIRIGVLYFVYVFKPLL